VLRTNFIICMQWSFSNPFKHVASPMSMRYISESNCLLLAVTMNINATIEGLLPILMTAILRQYRIASSSHTQKSFDTRKRVVWMASNYLKHPTAASTGDDLLRPFWIVLVLRQSFAVRDRCWFSNESRSRAKHLGAEEHGDRMAGKMADSKQIADSWQINGK